MTARLDPSALSAGLNSLKKREKATTEPEPTAGEGRATASSRRNFSLQTGDPSDIRRYQNYVQAFNIEKWLRQLGDATFETTIIPMSREDAEALLRCNVHEKEQNEEGESWSSSSLLPQLTEKLRTAMRALMNAGESGVFVKTSSRSAKDFAEPAALRSVFLSKRGRMLGGGTGGGGGGGGSDENTDMIAMSYASMELLKMQTPGQVMKIFNGSERIWHDMKLALACDDDSSRKGGDGDSEGGQSSCWDESLAVRRWVAIEPDMEFRCFVCAGALTAVSQYRHLLHFPRLVRYAPQLLRALQSFVEGTAAPRLHGLFPDDDYVLDLAVQLGASEGAESILLRAEAGGSGGSGSSSSAATAADADDGGDSDGSGELPITKVWAIEVNPFFETTDGALYSWTKDAAVLTGSSRGDDDIDFRFRTQPAKGASSLMYGSWRDIMTAGRAV